MDANEQIAHVLQKRLGGDYTVETRVDYNQYGLDSKAEAGLAFVIRNPLIENNPEQAQKDILATLASIEPLKPHIKLESETNHMERLAKELEYFREQELAQSTSGSTTIHNKTPEWFRELPKRDGWDIKHALNVSKEENGTVSIRINTPKDVSPEDIVKNMESRKVAILETLADRVVKYSPSADTPEKKQALKELAKRLEISITPVSNGDNKSVRITIMSPEQLAASKETGGITPDKVKDLNLTNPLLALQNGENDQDPDKTKPQPHLQKALARSILFSGENYVEILPYIMGKEDMRRMVGKSLTVLKNNSSGNPDMVKRIDAFLADPIFKDHYQWDKPVEKQEYIAQAPRFNKMSSSAFLDPSKPYEPGVMMVFVALPADKFPAIRDQIAALDGPAASAEQTADGKQMEQVVLQLSENQKHMAEAVVNLANNQLQLANNQKQLSTAMTPPAAPTTPVPAAASEDGSLRAAIKEGLRPFADVITKIVNNQKELANMIIGSLSRQATAPAAPIDITPPPSEVATLPSDEVMATTILAAAAASAETNSTGAVSAIAGGASTVDGWRALLDAQKTQQAGKESGISAA